MDAVPGPGFPRLPVRKQAVRHPGAVQVNDEKGFAGSLETAQENVSDGRFFCKGTQQLAQWAVVRKRGRKGDLLFHCIVFSASWS